MDVIGCIYIDTLVEFIEMFYFLLCVVVYVCVCVCVCVCVLCVWVHMHMCKYFVLVLPLWSKPYHKQLMRLADCVAVTI